MNAFLKVSFPQMWKAENHSNRLYSKKVIIIIIIFFFFFALTRLNFLFWLLFTPFNYIITVVEVDFFSKKWAVQFIQTWIISFP